MPSYNTNGIPFSFGSNPALQQLQTQQFVDDATRRNRAAQDQINADQFTNNRLNAERSALEQSHGLQSGPNPRTVTDTSMTISNGGQVQGTQNSRTTSGGGGTTGVRQLPPDLQGRFMPLIELGQQSIPSTPTPPEVQMPQPDYTPADATAHQNAAANRLKERAGQQGRSAITSLAEELAGRGISGASGSFGRGVADIAAQTIQPQSDLNVAHLGQEYAASGRARELSEARAGLGYQGGIQQRGQTIGAQQAIDQLRASLAQTKYQGEIAQRNQNLEAIYRMLI